VFSAVYHPLFTGEERLKTTLIIDNGTLAA